MYILERGCRDSANPEMAACLGFTSLSSSQFGPIIRLCQIIWEEAATQLWLKRSCDFLFHTFTRILALRRNSWPSQTKEDYCATLLAKSFVAAPKALVFRCTVVTALPPKTACDKILTASEIPRWHWSTGFTNQWKLTNPAEIKQRR